MISNRDVGEALLQNERVVSCQFLGKGIYLLRMEGDDLPMKTNSYGVMKIVDLERFNSEFSPRNFVTNLMTEDAGENMVVDNWEETESDDGHRELYDDLDIADTILE